MTTIMISKRAMILSPFNFWVYGQILHMMTDEGLDQSAIIEQLSSHPAATDKKSAVKIIVKSIESLTGLGFIKQRGHRIVMGDIQPAQALSRNLMKDLKGKAADRFNKFWEKFDYKKNKANAIKSWIALEAKYDAGVPDDLFAKILETAFLEAISRKDIISPMYPQAWINGHMWNNEVYARMAQEHRERERNRLTKAGSLDWRQDVK